MKHKWIVYSTALVPPSIMVYCENCDSEGYITDFTEEEWHQAFFASEKPYRWRGKGKVIISER
jgi:hypothetical protein